MQEDLISPSDKDNCLIFIFFNWINDVIAKCKKGYLNHSDLPPLSNVYKSEALNESLVKHWDEETKRKNPSFTRAVLSTFKVSVLKTCIYSIFDICIVTARPLIISWILIEFRNIENAASFKSLLYAFLVLIINLIMGVWFRNLYFYEAFDCGLLLRISVSTLIFKKTLNLNQKSVAQSSSGQIMNLFTGDSKKLEISFAFIHYLWLGFAQTTLILIMLYMYSGFIAFISIGVMLVFVFIQTINGNIYAKLKFKAAVQTDRRVKLISNIISGMKAIKVYCWEDLFIKFVGESRNKEINQIFLSRYSQTFQFSQLVYQPKIAMLLLFISVFYIFKENPLFALSSDQVIIVFGLINSLFISLTLYTPIAIQYLVETMVTLKRVQTFLLIKDNESEKFPRNLDDNVKQLTIRRVNATWTDSENSKYRSTLTNINLDVRGPKLIAVIGSVGSGKSSLAQLILGELPYFSGEVERSKSISYLSQQAWLYPGTIRDNILCGSEMDNQRYLEVLKVTTLETDCNRMPLGDLTLVGERGTSLSGGQKARIGLARAVYSRSSIVVLDDPLAAVDAKVLNHIFDECIKKFLSDRIVILITNQLHLINRMDMIILMKNGKIERKGTYAQLLKYGVNFDTLTMNFKEEASLSRQSSISHTEDHYEKRFSVTSSVLSDHQDECEFLNHMESMQRCMKGAPNRKVFRSSIRQIKLEKQDQVDAVATTGEGEDDYKMDDFTEEAEAEEEKRGYGSISFNLYYQYLTLGSGIFGFVTIIFLFLSTILLYGACDFWIAKWTNRIDLMNLRNITDANVIVEDYYFPNDENAVYILLCMTIALIILSTLRSLFFLRTLTKSSKILHNRMIASVMNTRMLFFETNNSGRILNRFSNDITQIDDMLPFNFHDCLQCTLVTLEYLCSAALASYYLLIMIAPLAVIFYIYRQRYLRLIRDLNRIDSLARSPVLTHLSVTIHGLASIRVMHLTKERMSSLFKHFDYHSQAVSTYLAAGRWLAIRLDLLCLVFNLLIIACGLYLGMYGTLKAGDFGLALMLGSFLIGIAQWTIRQSCEVENQMVCVERAFEYIKLKSEEETKFGDITAEKYTQISKTHDDFLQDDYIRAKTVHVPEEWPSSGRIEFHDVWMKYNTAANFALSGVNLTIEKGLKIGIVGRTGAGKSTLVSCIFRLVELHKGKVIIDGLDLYRLNLKDIRRRISIIPQDPIVFAGTIRSNIDPSRSYSDQAILKALKAVELSDLVESYTDGLNYPISEEGSNLSIGQRQLLSLARAILRGNKILVVDEATANVDPITDAIIQNTIRREFHTCTVITIAHRLHTVMDSDKIVVMEAGKVAEYQHPYALLKGIDNMDRLQDVAENDIECKVTGTSLLASLVLQTGEKESRKLCNIARKTLLH